GTVAPRPLAAAARRRLEMALLAEVAEGRLAGVDPEVNGAAAAAVAAVGAAARNVRLAAERRGAVTARAGLDEDLDAVEKHQADCRIRSVDARSPRIAAPSGRCGSDDRPAARRRPSPGPATARRAG